MAKECDRRYLLRYLEERFGIPQEIFDNYLFFSMKKSWWLLHKSPEISRASHLKVSMVGLSAFRRIGRLYIKPTTRMIQKFGVHAKKGIFHIDIGQLLQLISGEILEMERNLDNGYVILIFNGMPIGLGLLINGELRSQLPKRGNLLSLLRNHT